MMDARFVLKCAGVALVAYGVLYILMSIGALVQRIP